VLRASVPETTVDEDGDSLPPEEKVGAAPPVERQRCVDPVAKAAGVDETTDRQLALGVPPTGSEHPLPSFRRTRRG
jgi:hypothetical protein